MKCFQRELSNCEFCYAVDNNGTDVFKQFYGDSQILGISGLSDSFTALQDVVPLGEEGAHVLLVPKPSNAGHDISLAVVADQESVLWAGKVVVGTLLNVFPEGNPIFYFEHGPGHIDDQPIACGGCHMDHAHGHFVVLPKEEEDSLIVIRNKANEMLATTGWSEKALDVETEASLLEHLSQRAEGRPYLHFGMIYPNGDVKAYTYVQKRVEEYVESQLFRGIIASEIYKKPDPTFWHWRDIVAGFTSEERVSELRRNRQVFKERLGLRE